MTRGAPLAPPARREPLLVQELPELARSVPWMALATTPTPVERLDGHSAWLGHDAVWIKRDDRISPVYGGNKVRKFENVLADALERGARTLITAGGLASTQATATILFARALGLQAVAVLFDQPVTRFLRRALLVNHAAGGTLVRAPGYGRAALEVVRALRRTDRPYLIVPGACNPLANVGYVDAMLELASQVERGEMPRPDLIVLPSGSSGTLAGLALGAAYLGWPTPVVGVRITQRLLCNRATISLLYHATRRYLARRSPRFARRRLAAPRFSVFHGALGPGYGHPTAEAREGAARVEAITGEPGEVTYTGKALAGLRMLARAGAFRGKTVLYWHTLNGVPLETDDTRPEDLGPAFASCFEGDCVA